MPQFKLGLNIDNVTEKPPLELAPGWEAAEVPITELVLPYDGEETWKKKRDEIKSWHQPPFTAAASPSSVRASLPASAATSSQCLTISREPGPPIKPSNTAA
jgi:hypothetical protein